MERATLGPFRIERELGSGGMGRVYAATGPEGAVALEVVHPQLLETPGFFERFLREAQIGQTVRHENVVRTLDCDADGDRHYLVMEYVEGQTLTDLLRELGRLPEELCRHVGREIAKGLGAIHAAGVVHRDLKPENVIVTTRDALPGPARPTPRPPGGRRARERDAVEHVVKIMDLGVALLTDEQLRLSQTGAFVGSVEYASPEQFGVGTVDARTDLHALGILLYEVSSGEHPYRGGGFHEAMRRICSSEPRRLGEVNPQLSPFFEEVVHTLLVKDPRGRFASAHVLRDVLAQGEGSAWWRERARRIEVETKRPLRRVRVPRETAVYGRDAELAKLHGLYEAARSGDGQVVLLEGEAGIGKSRLVDELVARLHSSGEDVNFLFGSYPPSGAATASGAFSAAYREHLGGAGSEPYLPDTPVLVPAFDALLRGEGAPSGVEPLTKGSLQTCFANVTRSLAAERPTIVLIDDLHFAPDEGRALFTALAMALAGTRTLLVGTVRPGVPQEWTANLTRLEQTTHVPLHRLGREDLVDLLADSFGSQDLARSLATRIGERSDGNPFFTFEIVRGLREGQFVTQRGDGTWTSTRAIENISIPSSVLDLVNARVADLTEDERDLLDIASCWGYEFDPALVGDVLGIGRIPLLKRFGRIEREHRLVRSAGRRYVFDHHQVQEALYDSLHEQMREEYHAALAEALEARTNAAATDPEALDGRLCVELAGHYLKGGRGESALRYLPRALAHLRKSYLNDQAVELGERALGVPGLLAGTQRARTLLELTHMLDLLGRRACQEECAREAERLAEEADDDELRTAAKRALGHVFARTGRWAESLDEHGAAVDLARARGDRWAEACSLGGLGYAHAALGRLDDALADLQRALAINIEIGDRLGEATVLGNIGNVQHSRGRFEDAMQCHERHLALSRELGDRLGEARATGNLGNVLVRQGRLTEAADVLERQLALHREIGDRLGEANATGELASVFLYLCRYDESVAWNEQALALTREIDDRRGEARTTGNLANALSAQGLIAEGKVLHERHLALSRELADGRSEAIALINLAGVVRDEGGDPDEVESRLVACLAVADAVGYRHIHAAAQLALGGLRAERCRGDGGGGEAGRADLQAALVAAREIGVPGLEVRALCELALLPGDGADEALAAFAEFRDRLQGEERIECRFLLWKATGDVTDLEAARRLLDETLAPLNPETRDAMCRNVHLNREILAAWQEQSTKNAPADDPPPTSETETRVGLVPPRDTGS